jgi:transcriptional regulator with XRE-family HTH domain
MDIGPTIRQARLDAGFSQTELARRAGTSQATVSAYESGAKQPSVETLSRLLAATGRRLESIAPAARRARGSELAQRGRVLAEVLALAETLPARRKRKLAYPRLAPLAGPTG